MAFPHSLIYDNSLMTIIPDVLRAEVFRMAQGISTHKHRTNEVNREKMKILSNEDGFVVYGPTSLSDVFTVLNSEDFPLLWREYLKMNTIFQTKVSCEQTFSVIRRSFHFNMKKDTIIANVTNKIHERAEMEWY